MCFILCSYLEQIDLSAPGKIVCFTLFVLTKKPDFELLSISLFFPFTLSVMYVTQILLRIYMISLIRFSMNIPLTSVKVT